MAQHMPASQPDATLAVPRYCGSCGSHIVASASFCGSCGDSLGAQQFGAQQFEAQQFGAQQFEAPAMNPVAPVSVRETFDWHTLPFARPDFRPLSHMWGQILKRHSQSDTELQLGAVRAPAADPTPQPWFFLRVLVMFGLAFAVLYSLMESSENVIMLPTVIIVGAFAVPLASAIFFLEANVFRNISLYMFGKFFLAGGVLAIAIASVLYLNDGSLDTLGPPSAAFIEEPAKLAAVLLLARGFAGRWTLNGLALGAAVGAGFAAFESAGYALVWLSGSEELDSLVEITTLRGITSIGTHVIWTAVLVAALWTVMDGKRFEFNMLFDPRFLAPAGLVVALHFVWNSSFGEGLGWIRAALLMAPAIYLAASYLVTGIAQAKAELHEIPVPDQANDGGTQ